MRTSIRRTTADDTDFSSLVEQLDRELAERDGEDHAFYALFNKRSMLDQVIVVYAGKTPVACGALKKIDSGTAEIKRMFTLPDQRGKGWASIVLTELEKWAGELGYTRCILETGLKQPEALNLYAKNGYEPIPNYGPYTEDENSRCFMKGID